MKIDLIMVLVFLIVTLYVGFIGKRVTTVREFAVSKRNFSNSFMVATIFATWVGGDDLIGVAELASIFGISALFACFFQFFSLAGHVKFIAPRVLGEFSDAISIGEIVGRLYGKVGRILSGISLLLYSFGYVAIQVSSLGYVFHWLCGIPFFEGALIGSTIVVLYSSFGGIRSVVFTDFLQFAVLVVAIPVVASTALNSIGGFEEFLVKTPTSLLSLDLPKPKMIEIILISLVMAIPSFNPLLVQRTLMSRDMEQARRSMMVSAFLYIPFYTMIVLIAFCALISNSALEPNQTFMYVVSHCLSSVERGIAVVGILAVTMSTADSHINLASVAIVNDVIAQVFPNISEKNCLKIMRAIGVVITFSAVLVAAKFEKMLDFWAYYCLFWTPIASGPLMYIMGCKLEKRNFFIAVIIGYTSIAIYRSFVPEYCLCASYLVGLICTIIPGLLIHALFEHDTNCVPQTPEPSPKKEEDEDEDNEDSLKYKLIQASQFCKNFWPNVVKASDAAVKRHGARYVAFGAFSLINYMMPLYMWSERNASDPSVLTIRIIAGILSFMLLVSDAYVGNMRKYITLLWHFTIMYCLPFLTFYMLLFEGPTLFWIINISLAIITGLILLDTKAFYILYPIGFIAAFSLIKVLGHAIAIVHPGFSSIYLLVFSVTIVLLFFRDQENLNRVKLDAIKVFGGSISHELRTPLTIVSLHLKKITKNLKALSEQETVKEDEIKAVVQDLNVMDEQCNQMFDRLSVAISNLRIADSGLSSKLSQISVSTLLDRTLKEYPFPSQEIKNCISVSLEDDFDLNVDKESMKCILFNILQNALYQVMAKRSGEVYITARNTPTHNLLSIKDTASGISKSRLKKIFLPFISYTPGGTGIGLAFCKKAIEDMGGELYCESEEGKYAIFTISFPRFK